jgi:EAL domain-containing protein (putative c-di-GMP-specific phosphodiesterase class I)
MSGGELERLVVFVESADGKVVRDSSPMRAVEPPPIATAPAVDGALASAFPEALANGEIAAAFQPIVSLQTGKVVGYEALARWRAEGRERAGAEALVAAAEACGLGGALAEFMLEAAAEHLARELKPGARNLFVALNVSYRQICEPEFPAAVKKAMREHALPPKSIVLELTETQAISDPKAAASVFRSLRDAGAALAFDDFGAGFSSLANLQKFSFDYLKIDKSFIETLSKGGDGLKIARAIAGLGRDLGLTVIAEGVETRELADLAKAAGCTLGQGYAFGVPKAERSAHGQPRLSERRIAAEMR